MSNLCAGADSLAAVQAPAANAEPNAASEKRIASLKEGNKELQEELSVSQRMVRGVCARRVCEACVAGNQVERGSRGSRG